jgi:flavin reductase (DIM6/NTAB) family NADH-FMN oxidoreductase RutF
MSEKTSIDVKMFWYTHILVIPKFVSIVTTIDKAGAINAAPYSLGTPFNIGKKHPQILLVMRRSSHTCRNVIETGEFVVNFPSSKYLQDVMTTAQFMPKEENELEHTQFTVVASKIVKAPSITECSQHLECRLHNVIDLDYGQVHVIGDIVAIVVDKDLVGMNRHDRIKALDPPVYLGDEQRKHFYFGRMDKIEQLDFQIPEQRDRRKQIRTNMPWDEVPLSKLLQMPLSIREMVIELIEGEARKIGDSRVTEEFYRNLEKEYLYDDIDNRHY